MHIICGIIMAYTRGGGLEVCSPGKIFSFLISEAILGHLKQFLNTVHRSVYCNCTHVL